MEEKEKEELKEEKNEKKKGRKKNKSNKKKKGAFTLIELLAVIIILGIVMVIAVPSVTKAISTSRDKTYIATIKSAIGSAKTMVNSGDFDLYDPGTSYYIPMSCIKTEKSLKSPYGDFDEAYILVTYNEDGYDYYYTGTDSSKVGIKNIVKVDDLEPKVIERNVSSEDIRNNVGVDGRTNYGIFNEDCTDMTMGVTNVQYNSATGVIKERKLVETIEQNNEGRVSVGDEIVIGEKEHFFVISTDSENTRLIAKYNLYVGAIVDYLVVDHHGSHSIRSIISESDSRYGWQDSEALGYRNWGNNYVNVGVVPFSSSRYWLGSDNKVLSKYGGPTNTSPIYNVNVYDTTISAKPNMSCTDGKCRVTNDGYSISYYVKQYEDKLKSLGLDVHDVRLLRTEEVGRLGCGTSWNSYHCTGYDYSFLRNTNFWLEGIFTEESLRYVYFSNIGFEYENDVVDDHGVRPVIEISTSEIPLLDHEYFENKPIIVY